MENSIESQILNEYSKSFTKTVLADIPSEKRVTGKEILTLTPSRQVNFFILKILYGRWQDEIKKLESPYFNYGHDEVKKALNTFMNVLSQHIEVAPEHLKDIITEAVSLTLRWLFFPAEVLREEISAREIHQAKGVKSLSRYFKIYADDLSYMLGNMENDEAGTFLEEWAELMDQKSRDSIIQQEIDLLSQVSPITSEALFGKEETADISEEDDGSVEVQEQVSIPQEAEEANEDVPEVEATPKEVDNTSELSETLEEPKDEQEVEVQDEIDEDQQVDIEDSVNQQFAQDQETLHDQYKEDQVSVAAKHQQKKISSILEAVSVNQEFMFTSELFGGSKDVFLEAVDKIEACGSFDESVETLVSNYAEEYSWDMNGTEVKELLKVVFRRFR